MKPKIKRTDFGDCWFYNYSKYRFALYRYSDSLKSLYLANVEVFERYRNNGLGNLILRKADHYAKRKKASELFLKCETGCWVSGWYKRHGFKHFSDEENFEWLRKEIQY